MFVSRRSACFQETLIKWGAKYVPLMRENGEYWRLVTATFVHAGAVHFILNMAIQLTVGIALERVFGWWRFTIVYLLSGIGGNILSGIFLPQVRVFCCGLVLLFSISEQRTRGTR